MIGISRLQTSEGELAELLVSWPGSKIFAVDEVIYACNDDGIGVVSGDEKFEWTVKNGVVTGVVHDA